MIGLASALFVQSVQAEIYTCKDAAGHTLTSDRPIPECANRAMFVRQNPNQKQKQEEILEEQRKREELYILANFKSENDIELSRQRSIAIVKEKIRVGNEQIKAIGNILTDLQQQDGTKKSAIENTEIQKRANQLAVSIKNTRTSNEQYEAELIRINTQFDETLKRYREIVLRRKR